ncbi:hypothetical protein ACPA9J_19865 [Pseudomonas aeruginosa]
MPASRWRRQLALTPHPRALGSTLTHPQITTDYSEALLEFITPTETDVARHPGRSRAHPPLRQFETGRRIPVEPIDALRVSRTRRASRSPATAAR